MDHAFWHARWEANEIGFHQAAANPLLVRHLPVLGLGQDARIFVPLCGKTLDIGWLLSRGMRVVGSELSARAVEDLFADLGVTPTVAEHGSLTLYSADGIDIYAGDIFELTAETLGPVDAIFDRAALVALPEEMRVRYTGHLRALTAAAPQLLITFVYDQSVMSGPPFSITAEEVEQHYSEAYALATLEDVDVFGGLKGMCPAREVIWHAAAKA